MTQIQQYPELYMAIAIYVFWGPALARFPSTNILISSRLGASITTFVGQSVGWSICLSLEKNVKNCQKQWFWTNYENKSCRSFLVHQINIFRPYVCWSVGKVANQQGSQGFLNHTYLELSVARNTFVLSCRNIQIYQLYVCLNTLRTLASTQWLRTSFA